MTTPWQVLIASSNVGDRGALASILARHGVDPICASTLGETHEILAREAVGLIFCDRWLSDGDYRDLLAQSRSLEPKVRVIVTSRLADWDEYLEAMNFGAFDVIAAPCRPKEVEWMLVQAKRDERSLSGEPVRQTGNEHRGVEVLSS
jgi:DNA-binding NtrC family response regulator